MRSFPLADELFLIGHDEYTGKSVINGTLLDTGLAGAVIGELVLAGRATVSGGRVVVQDPQRTGEPVSDAALAEMLKHPKPYTVRAWCEYLRDEVREIVGRRLVAGGVVRREQSRGLS